MPTYTYKCEDEHLTELVLPIADEKPEAVTCTTCRRPAARVFHSPIAVHWSGAGGSYHEDVYRNEGGRYGWKRRKNAADRLPIEVS